MKTFVPVQRLPAGRGFSSRSVEHEWLDEHQLDPDELAKVLHDLARFNRALIGTFPIFMWLNATLSKRPGDEPLRLLDVGCGNGALLRSIRRWADRRRLDIELLGLDANGDAIQIARAASGPGDRISFEIADVLNFRPSQPIDIIVNSLLAHHLRDGEIVGLLRWMDGNARRGWLVCDLHRHPLPYHVIGLAGLVSPIHPLVISDGKISVRRALTRSEWQSRLDEAGIPRDAAAPRWFLFRWLVGRSR